MSSSYYKQQKKGKEAELRSYRKRLTQLEPIRDSLGSSFDDCADDITVRCRNVNQSMREAIKLQGGSVDTGDSFKSERGSDDSNLSQARNYINSEIRTVSNKITELQSQISRLEKTIASEQQKEKAEAEAKKAAAHR